MPLKKCTVDGKSGYQWGDVGKCYTGPSAKKKAIKQGVAIEGPKKFSQKAVEENIALSAEDIDAIVSFMYDEGNSNTSIVATIAALSSSKTKKEWDKIDKKELKRDTKKEKKEHEKDAIKDDKEKLKRLKKDPPSEKKKRETKDLKKDERYDKRDASDRQRHERLDRDEYDQDKREMDSETLHQRLKHHKDAIKNIEREIRDLKKDKREDEKDVRTESKGAKLTRKAINDLPDSEFAYIAPGGKKVDGKTEPRSLRHLPIPDAAHVRNALARLSQTDIPPAAKKSALAKIKAKAKKLGVEVSDGSKAAYEGDRTTSLYTGDREGYGHFHTFTKGAKQTSKARTRFGDLIITGHFHEIVDGKIMPADGHTHTIKDIGPGEGWVYGD